jgi:hypothetical protein
MGNPALAQRPGASGAGPVLTRVFFSPIAYPLLPVPC